MVGPIRSDSVAIPFWLNSPARPFDQGLIWQACVLEREGGIRISIGGKDTDARHTYFPS